MTSSIPPDRSAEVSPRIDLASIQQLRNWFDAQLIVDFRKLEQTRRSSINTIVVVTLIFSVMFGSILVLGWCLLPPITPIASKSTSPAKTAGICPPGIAQSECDLLTSNPQITGYLAQQKIDLKEESGYSLIEFYQIPLSIFVTILALGWIFITFIGGVIDNYRVGWRSPIVRKVIDFIDTDRLIAYIGQAEAQDVRQSLLHSGMANSERQELIYINLDDSISIKWQNMRIVCSDLQATIPTDSLLSVIDSFFKIIHEQSGLQRLFKLNFASLIIKAIRSIVYLFKSLIIKQFDADDFTREVIGNDAGRKIIFQGMFCQILRPEANELGQMLVVPKQAKLKIPNYLGKAFQIADPEFDRLFTIYSRDRTTPLQILSPAVRRSAINYYRTSRCPIYLSANDRMTYIGITTSSQFLEPKLGRNMLTFAPVRDYYNAIKFMLDIAANLEK